MPGNDAALGIGQDRIGESKRGDRRLDLFDLLFGMGARITRVGCQIAHGPVTYRQPPWCFPPL